MDHQLGHVGQEPWELGFEVGITVLNQHEHLRRCLESLLANSIHPDRTLIVDNGWRLNENIIGAYYETSLNPVLIQPNSNLGVAASWNLLLRLIHPKVPIILNDDCVLKPDSLKQMLTPFGPAYVRGHGNACFRLDEAIYERVGPFDEAFWPAYCEDADYNYRCRLLGIQEVQLWVLESHGGQVPYQGFNAEELAEFHENLRRNHDYYERKWGGRIELEKYKVPFDGNSA